MFWKCRLRLCLLHILQSAFDYRSWRYEPWWNCTVWFWSVLLATSWLLCGSSSRCNGFVCSLWLWYFLIINTNYFQNISTNKWDVNNCCKKSYRLIWKWGGWVLMSCIWSGPLGFNCWISLALVSSCIYFWVIISASSPFISLFVCSMR